MPADSILRTGLRWGAALGGFLVFYGLLFRALELSYKSLWAWVFYLAVAVAGYLALASAERRGLASGFRQAVSVVLLTAAVGSAIYTVSVYTYNSVIDDSLLLEVRADLIASSLATEPESASRAEQLRRIEAFTSPGLFSLGAFLRLTFVGLLAAVILGWWLVSRALG